MIFINLSIDKFILPVVYVLTGLFLINCSSGVEDFVSPESVSSRSIEPMYMSSEPQMMDAAISAKSISVRTVPPPALSLDQSISVSSGSNLSKSLTQSDSDQIESAVLSDRIIVRTVVLDVLVRDIDFVLTEITNYIKIYGGWVVSKKQSKKFNATISLRVKSDQLDDFLKFLKDAVVEVESITSTSKDVTDEFIDYTAQLNNLEATQKTLKSFLDKSESLEDALSVNNAMSENQDKIFRIKGKLKYLEQTSEYSLVTISLNLEPIKINVDIGENKTEGIGKPVKFRATFFHPGLDKLKNPTLDFDEYEFIYTWDFGDGSDPVIGNKTSLVGENQRSTATVTHYYFDDVDSPYVVNFKITGNGDSGVVEGKNHQLVTITQVPVIEVFSGEDLVENEMRKIEFNGSFTSPADINNISYRWDFSDGTPPKKGVLENNDSTVTVYHFFKNARPMPYLVRLTISADSPLGKVESFDELYVTVNSDPGWIVGGWDIGEISKTAIRSLTVAIKFILWTVLWLIIFSPIWVGLLVAIIYIRKRFLSK